jgi:hypothetical protein
MSLTLLPNTTDEIAGDVFDMLLSFADFDEYKSLMLACQQEKEHGPLIMAPTVTPLESACVVGVYESGSYVCLLWPVKPPLRHV